jgi:hypothetical protein
MIAADLRKGALRLDHPGGQHVLGKLRVPATKPNLGRGTQCVLRLEPCLTDLLEVLNVAFSEIETAWRLTMDATILRFSLDRFLGSLRTGRAGL